MEFINTILFELGGKPVLLIDLLSAVFGLTVVFLAGRNSKYNFYVGYLYTALLFFMFWQKHLYANLILQPISLGINILGQYRWSPPRKDFFRRFEGYYAFMAVAVGSRSIGFDHGPGVGMVDEPVRYEVVCRTFSSQPFAVS